MEYNSKSNSMNAIRSLVLALLFMLAFPAMGFAQQISGTVTDEQGEPLIGVTVLVEKTKTGVSTDIDGKYVIAAKAGQVLSFSYVGMEPQKIKVGGKKVIDVVMKQNAENLDEVVVVG